MASEKYIVTEDERNEFKIGGGLSVRRESGKMVGYIVKEPDPSSKYFSAGFNKGDLITHVNGLDVTLASNLREVYQAIKTSESLEVQLQRGSIRMPLIIRVEFVIKDNQ